MNEILYNPIDQIRVIFNRMPAAGLKVNTPMCIFLLKDIPHPRYAITQEVIKPDQNKVQEIIDIERPSTITEAQGIIGMVH